MSESFPLSLASDVQIALRWLKGHPVIHECRPGQKMTSITERHTGTRGLK
jgi:hypothetical protein